MAYSSISEYYGDLSAPIFTAKTCLYWAQTLLGDGVIVRLPFHSYHSWYCAALPNAVENICMEWKADTETYIWYLAVIGMALLHRV